MAADNVETAEFINGLDPTLPPRDGQRSNGDDIFRLIKGALRRTFPSLTGAVELTQADINGLPARVNALEGSAVRIPPAGGPVTVGGRQLIGVGYPIEGVPSQAPNIQWVIDYVRLIVLDQIYPIGSILINGSGINPQTYIGGTWIAQGQGRVLVGVGAGTDSRGEARAFALGESGGIDATIDLPTGASGIQLTIQDSKGRTVQDLIAGPQNPGTASLSWDGLDAMGNRAPAGNYRLLAKAVVNGKTTDVPVNTMTTVRAISTSASDGAVSLQVDGNQSVLLKNVQRIGM